MLAPSLTRRQEQDRSTVTGMPGDGRQRRCCTDVVVPPAGILTSCQETREGRIVSRLRCRPKGLQYGLLPIQPSVPVTEANERRSLLCVCGKDSSRSAQVCVQAVSDGTDGDGRDYGRTPVLRSRSPRSGLLRVEAVRRMGELEVMERRAG